MSELQLSAPQTPSSQLDLFNALYFIGLAALTVVILPPLFSRYVRRSGLWFNFIGSWMVYCLSFLLLVGHQLGPNPSFGLCMFQASLIHATPSLYATLTGVCFILDIYISLRLTVLPPGHSSWIPKNRTPALLAVPVVAFFALVFLSLGIGLQDHTTVSREPNNMFCHINTGLPTLVSAVLSGWSMLIAVGVQVAAGIMLYQNWHRTPLHKTHTPSSEAHNDITPPMLIRICLFSVLTILGLSLSAIMLFHIRESDTKWNALLPILPTLAAILFGSQKDILMGWVFWKRPGQLEKAEVGAV